MKPTKSKILSAVGAIVGILVILLAFAVYGPPNSDPEQDREDRERDRRDAWNSAGATDYGNGGGTPSAGSTGRGAAGSRIADDEETPDERAARLAQMLDAVRDYGVPVSEFAEAYLNGFAAGLPPWVEEESDAELVFEPTEPLLEAMHTVDTYSRGELLRTVDTFAAEFAAEVERWNMAEPIETFRAALAEGVTLEYAFREVFERHGARGRGALNAILAMKEAEILESMAKYWGTDRHDRAAIYLDKLDSIHRIRDEFTRSFHYR